MLHAGCVEKNALRIATHARPQVVEGGAIALYIPRSTHAVLLGPAKARQKKLDRETIPICDSGKAGVENMGFAFVALQELLSCCAWTVDALGSGKSSG